MPPKAMPYGAPQPPYAERYDYSRYQDELNANAGYGNRFLLRPDDTDALSHRLPGGSSATIGPTRPHRPLSLDDTLDLGANMRRRGERNIPSHPSSLPSSSSLTGNPSFTPSFLLGRSSRGYGSPLSIPDPFLYGSSGYSPSADGHRGNRSNLPSPYGSPGPAASAASQGHQSPLSLSSGMGMWEHPYQMPSSPYDRSPYRTPSDTGSLLSAFGDQQGNHPVPSHYASSQGFGFTSSPVPSEFSYSPVPSSQLDPGPPDLPWPAPSVVHTEDLDPSPRHSVLSTPSGNLGRSNLSTGAHSFASAGPSSLDGLEGYASLSHSGRSGPSTGSRRSHPSSAALHGPRPSSSRSGALPLTMSNLREASGSTSFMGQNSD